ncbi:MAG: hypothetical protein PVI30_17905 [Myxococcales bacterium]|jgi:serine/threonine-protein kinase
MPAAAEERRGEWEALGPYRVQADLSAAYYGLRKLATSAHVSTVQMVTVIESQDPAMLQRLSRAAECFREVDGAVLGAMAVDTHDATLLIAAPFVEGATVGELLAAHDHDGAGGMPTDVAARIALDALEALEALIAHAEGNGIDPAFVHGILHPDTLHVGVDGRTRLLDVGLAEAAAREPRWSESERRLAYASPEGSDALSRLDERSDMFSLGAIVWEMLACRPLFDGRDAHRLRAQLLSAPIPRVKRDRFVRGEPISAALADIVARMLAREPEGRFAIAGAAAAALRDLPNLATAEEVGAHLQTALGEALVRRPQISEVVELNPDAREFEDEVLDLELDEFDAPTQPKLELPRLPNADGAETDEQPTLPPPAIHDAARPSPHTRDAGRRRAPALLLIAALALASVAAWALLGSHDHPEPPAAVGSQAEADSETGTGGNSEAVTGADSEAASQIGAETDSDIAAASETETDPEAETGAETGAGGNSAGGNSEAEAPRPAAPAPRRPRRPRAPRAEPEYIPESI